MSPSDPVADVPTPASGHDPSDQLGDLLTVVQRCLGDVPLVAARLAREVGRSVDQGRLPLVLPAALAAEHTAGPADRAWLVDELERTYGGRSSAGWHALVDAGLVELVVLDEATADPTDLDTVVPVRRVELDHGQAALHPTMGWPVSMPLIGGLLVAFAAAVLLWSYDISVWISAGIGLAVGAVFAEAESAPLVTSGRRTSVVTWAARRRQAAVGAALVGALSGVIGLLAIDGLVARDALLVVLSLVVAGAWIGGADLLVALAVGPRGHRRVADVLGIRVVERTSG